MTSTTPTSELLLAYSDVKLRMTRIEDACVIENKKNISKDLKKHISELKTTLKQVRKDAADCCSDDTATQSHALFKIDEEVPATERQTLNRLETKRTILNQHKSDRLEAHKEQRQIFKVLSKARHQNALMYSELRSEARKLHFIKIELSPESPDLPLRILETERILQSQQQTLSNLSEVLRIRFDNQPILGQS